MAEVRQAISDAAAGNIKSLQTLYDSAAQALQALDPDEVADWRRAHPRAASVDRATARAAVDVAETWEGVVCVGSAISDGRRFRGFAWLAAHARYIGTVGPDIGRVRGFAQGGQLPRTSAEDSALYAALPALVGLGPELPEELPGPCPIPGEVVWRLLGLPQGDWGGIDPLDGIAIDAEQCRAHLAGVPAAWRDLVARCAETGLIARKA
jgi:hypothetical protein